MGVLGQQDLGSGVGDNVRRFGPRVPSTTAPNGQVIGDLWYDISTLTLKAWNGTAWVGVASGSALVYDAGLELYQGSSTPYIDFHNAANPAGDSGADFAWRLIANSGTNFTLDYATGTGFGTAFNFFNDGEFQCDHIGVGQDNTDNQGIMVGNNRIQGTGGRNWFKDSELSTGTGLRVGALFGVYGIYAEDGDLMLASASGKTSIQNGQYTFTGTAFQTWSHPIILSSVSDDGTHRLYYSTGGVDGPHLSGFNGLQFLFSNGGGTMQWDNSGQLFTNYGCGLDGAWILQSRYAGAATGGALRTMAGGNVFRVQWGGPLDFYIDVTKVKTFVIEHPSNKEKYLVHGTLEGPEAGVYYRGQGQLEKGWAEINLPDYFEDLCLEEGRSVQLTCIADDPTDEWCPVIHATYPKNGKFYVGLGSGVVVDDQRFWWEVKAIRKDVSILDVEPSKKNVSLMGDGPYTYLKEK